MLMSLTGRDGLAHFTGLAEETLRHRTVISCHHLAFRVSPTVNSITPYNSRRWINGYMRKGWGGGEKTSKVRKNRNYLGLAHYSLSSPSYLPSCPWAHHISSLMNSPIKKGSSISPSSFLSQRPHLYSPSVQDIRLSFAVLDQSLRSADLLHIKDPIR